MWWQKLGSGIAKRMPYVVLICVTTGIMFPQELAGIAQFVPVFFAFMTFQGSLSNTLHQTLEVFRHPADLLAILVISLVLMPIGANLLARLFFAGDIHLITGLVLAYSVPVGIVSFMWVSMFQGNTPLALAVILISTVISPISIPLSLSIFLGEAVHMDALGMMHDMVFMIALPALAGTLLNDFTHGWAHEKLSPAISPAARILMMIIITSNATALSDAVRHLSGVHVMVACFTVCYTGSGFLWGALVARLMQRPFSTLVTMCFDCGLRNISSGAVIASSYFPNAVMFPVMCGTIFQQLLASLAGSIMQKLTQEERAHERHYVARGLAALRARKKAHKD
ncbi:bile acid:sodium symporter family protein [Collinsella sp. zg1085]|uniref:bile acid:sodium symporter family protein n=1 Tax=Collinsella sp. zg1085 TaxID=2844380 RepID=UPI001C0D7D19|nr:bile acid:sodium symporter family protein [Collinsella sp. zg1085]QWT18129.1 bile acid:sodium symporter family protein [Collinsella sp. zg1085]